ncbi:MAG: hypothetical protein ABW185_11560 [Sedimenticola sp.]
MVHERGNKLPKFISFQHRGERALTKYLDKHPLVVPTSENTHIAILLSDSKAARLQAVDTGQEFPLEYLYQKGKNTESLVKLLDKNLKIITEKHGKPPVVYVWAGTCDITTKTTHPYINIKQIGDVSPAEVIRQYEKAKTRTLSSGGKIKFIGLPIYSVSEYNRVKGHPEWAQFVGSDREVERQIEYLNEKIVELNADVARHTLKFNADLRDLRHKNKPTYYYDLLEDGLHPGKLLSEKWLRKLKIDITRECYAQPGDAITVDPQEYVQFE